MTEGNKLSDLKERCSQFYTLQLPGQPRLIHIGTCSLVRDLEEEVERLREALVECRDEIDQYIWQEYPSDHPVHERCRKRDLSANPARLALNTREEE